MPVKQQEKLSSSVRVRFLNASKVIKELEAVSRNITKRNKNVLSIYLFGSLATGNYAPGSDADILILLKDDKRRFVDRIPEFSRCFLDVYIATDVFPYTEKEIEKRVSTRDTFITRLWKEKLLFTHARQIGDVHRDV